MSDFIGTWYHPTVPPIPDGETIWTYDAATGEGRLAPGWAWRWGEFNEERGYRDIVFYRVPT